MDKIEKARELFRKLEEQGKPNFAEVARRAFCIQERLSCIKS